MDRGGFSYRVATRASEALTVLDDWQPDVIVSDIGMPDMDGYEFARRLRARLHRPRAGLIPALALSALARAEDRELALRSGYPGSRRPNRWSPAELVKAITDLTHGVSSPGGWRKLCLEPEIRPLYTRGPAWPRHTPESTSPPASGDDLAPLLRADEAQSGRPRSRLRRSSARCWPARAGRRWTRLILGNLGIALASACAATINHVLDRRIDEQMARTKGRPFPTGAMKERQALIFAAVLGVTSMVILSFLVNRLTAALTFASLIGYAVIYTVWLKRATSQNIVIGGAARRGSACVSAGLR